MAQRNLVIKFLIGFNPRGFVGRKFFMTEGRPGQIKSHGHMSGLYIFNYL